jgi:hypothetical protein
MGSASDLVMDSGLELALASVTRQESAMEGAAGRRANFVSLRSPVTTSLTRHRTP